MFICNAYLQLNFFSPELHLPKRVDVGDAL